MFEKAGQVAGGLFPRFRFGDDFTVRTQRRRKGRVLNTRPDVEYRSRLHGAGMAVLPGKPLALFIAGTYNDLNLLLEAQIVKLFHFLHERIEGRIFRGRLRALWIEDCATVKPQFGKPRLDWTPGKQRAEEKAIHSSRC
ncbi:MAG: hypothetical protein BWY09_01145 [Candidatus Hydrogenedentes bacterium ADurb.Bin179]|nr:MAG: hypothetical protein BWY09_01145 [Candidatus Hydrogenedentes bacterium ADurb.Bin179]